MPLAGAGLSGSPNVTGFGPAHNAVCATRRALPGKLVAFARHQNGNALQRGPGGPDETGGLRPVDEAQQRDAVPDRFKGFPIFAWSVCIGPAIAKLYEEFKAGGNQPG